MPLKLISAITVLGGCASLRLTIYDPISYKNLTDLKAQVIALYESFEDPEIDPHAVYDTKLKFAQAYEYEKGKGVGNEQTIHQISNIREEFDRHVNLRKKGRVWTKDFAADKIESVTRDFDNAIQTEQEKNKERKKP